MASESQGLRSWLDRLSKKLLGEPRDRDQLVELLRDAEDRNLFDADALAMIEGALHVSEMQVRDVMVPRGSMAIVESSAEPADFLPQLIESGHSRFPVIGDGRDEVLGILLAKDLLSWISGDHAGAFPMRDMMRPAIFIPESKRLNILLRDFRASRNHMAIVVDEYGGVAGLVTIEDVIEQIVGEIDDEHDIDEDDWIKQHGDGHYTVKALTPIEDFNETFGTHHRDEDFETVGGMLLKSFGHLPRRGETLSIDGLTIKVLRADKRRVHLVRILIAQPAAVTDEQTAE